MGLSIICFKVSQVEISKFEVRSLKIKLNLADSADPDEMSRIAAVHLLPKYLYRGFQYTNMLILKRHKTHLKILVAWYEQLCLNQHKPMY